MKADMYDALSLVRGAMCLSDRAWCETRKKHQRIDIDQPERVYYLGSVSEYGPGGKRILHAPVFFGLRVPAEGDVVLLECREICDLWLISREDFDALLDEREFLRGAYKLLTGSARCDADGQTDSE